MAISLAALTACEVIPDDGPANDVPQVDVNAVLEVATTKVEMHFAGGEGSINYRLKDVAEGFKSTPDVTVNVDWVKIISTEDKKVVFNVDMNNVTERRVATLTISYGEQSFNVFVEQAEGYTVDVEFVATALNGEYSGTQYSIDPNYFIILSKNGTTGWSDLYLDTYYRFDIYSKTAADASAPKPTLPHGVYTYDPLNSDLGNTFNSFYSVRFQTFEDGTYKETKIDDGVVIVTENKIEAIIKMDDGKVHRVVYEGSLELGYIEIPEPDYYSTLTEDYTFNHPDGVLRLVNYGDYYGIGANNWSVSMVLPGDPINGDYFLLDIVTDDLDNSQDAIIGTYKCVADEESVAKNTFITGTMNGNNYLYSWYQVIVDNYVDHGQVAPLSGGTITISRDGLKYTVAYDCEDDNGHKIKGSFTTSYVEEYQPQ